jgi:uncharacterized SAM-binding protein YcdF (DUF218 family)
MLFTAPAVFNKKSSSQFRRLLRIFLGTAVLSTALAYASLPLVGHWLVREDPIQHADAIAVLAGRFPDRVVEAARLYRDGYAPEIWLTQPPRPLGADGISESALSGEDILNFKVLLAFGVPLQAIRILGTPTVNTADELNAIDAGLKENNENSVIIVTNKAHTRRVFSLWGKYHFGDGLILLHAVSGDSFSPSHWWQSAESRAQAIHEFLGMVNLWAGMPVHKPLSVVPAVAPTTSASSATSASPDASSEPRPSPSDSD